MATTEKPFEIDRDRTAFEVFDIYDPTGKYVMTAPLTTVERVFDLHPAAVNRLQVEALPGKFCKLHRNRDPWPLKIDFIAVTVG